uniref:Uncharacterized protein n=1 Tax=Anguilla anguilla TaxID=7936 RepID=A0A0E9VQB6_ANGAN
MFMEGLWIHPV